MLSRRRFLATASTAAAATPLAWGSGKMNVLRPAAFRNDALNLVERLVGGHGAGPEEAALDEEFWVQIQEAFTLDRTMVNFNNGGCSPSPRVVEDALKRYIDYANQGPSFYMWRHQEPEVESVRRRLAAVFGADPEEIAITRNASESLETCLFGIDLKPGDEILTSTLDYPRMITTIKQRERREGVKMVQAKMPIAPKRRGDLADAFEAAITPRTKMILVSQVSFLNGQIFPVRDICRMGAARGIPVIVDGAHAFCHLPFQHKDLECDYYGSSLHKWLMAPIGTGMLYVKKDRIERLWGLYAGTAEQAKDIRKYEEIGTHPAANHNAIAEALTFHELIGQERKTARLRYLRSRWVDRIQEERGVRFHTNLSPDQSCALTTVEIMGVDNGKLGEWLWEKHRIFVTPITHEDFKGIRVTPNVYTTLGEVDRFAEAMLVAARQGIA